MRIAIAVVIGSALGFGVGYFGKCVSGGCPITSNPLVSAIFGALLGFLFALGK